MVLLAKILLQITGIFNETTSSSIIDIASTNEGKTKYLARLI
jgi:hypothetical protein